MIDKIRKARKSHVCSVGEHCNCGRTIEKGELYHYFSLRIPRVDCWDEQVGIEYLKIKTCSTCYNKDINEKNEYARVSNSCTHPDTVSTNIDGDMVCSICGTLENYFDEKIPYLKLIE